MKNILIGAASVLLLFSTCKKYEIEGEQITGANGTSGTTGANGTTVTVTDIDGNIYNTIAIGSQVWMAENLKVTKYKNGDPIPNVSLGSVTYGAWCYYNNSQSNSVYGKLYNWYAANDSRNICPTGWHIPTSIEWNVLKNYLGGDIVVGSSVTNIAGGALKETGISHWWTPNSGATNTSGFTGLPGGTANPASCPCFGFNGIGNVGMWWSSSIHTGNYGWDWHLNSSSSQLYDSPLEDKARGCSIRCVKD